MKLSFRGAAAVAIDRALPFVWAMAERVGLREDRISFVREPSYGCNRPHGMASIRAPTTLEPRAQLNRFASFDYIEQMPVPR